MRGWDREVVAVQERFIFQTEGERRGTKEDRGERGLNFEDRGGSVGGGETSGWGFFGGE